MRQAQAEYESCADQYQLRIKTLNKVIMMIMMIMMITMTKNYLKAGLIYISYTQHI